MTTKNKSIARLSVFVLGALLVGASGKAARAAEPTTADEAAAAAQHSSELAARYRQLGGVGYKSGLVQRADADAARYATLAEQLRSPAMAERSPEAEHYAQLAEQYRRLGGVAYKTGAVQWAEAQQRKYESQPMTAAAERPTQRPGAFSWCAATKPAVRTLACSK